jgi:hypothetical protein
MKALTLIALLLLFMTNCSSSTESNDILNRLLESKMAGGNFEKQPSGKDTLKYYGPENLVLIGSSQVVNNHLVITIYNEGQEMEVTYDLAVYAPGEAEHWQAVFEGETVPGRLDTIIDLNGDRQPEFIVDEYKGNSAGFNSVQALYARLGEAAPYERVDTLSHRYMGGSAYNVRTAAYTYVPSGFFTKIVVYTEQSDQPDEGFEPTWTKGSYLLSWQPPHLVTERKGEPTSPTALAEAQAELDELAKPERKTGLLMISYYENEGIEEVDHLYFSDELSAIKFRDYNESSMDDVLEIHIEFDHNAIIRATRRRDPDFFPGLLLYVKDGQKKRVALQLQIFSQGGYKEMATADSVTHRKDDIDEIDYVFDPDNDKYIAFIRQNIDLFTPGKKYVYATETSKYEVDSLLWVREFAGR